MARRPRAARKRAAPRGVREPRRLERAYIAALKALYRDCSAIIARGVAPLLAAWPASETTTDAKGDTWQDILEDFVRRSSSGPAPPAVDVVNDDTIRRSFGWVEVQLGRRLRDKATGALLMRLARGVDSHVSDELGTILRIDLRRDVPGLRDAIDEWRRANIDLIESGIRAESASPRLRGVLQQVGETVESAHARGARVEVLAAELRERFEVSQSRAELIARDQVLKLNGQINQTRQRAVGIVEYEWGTSRDGKVREAHRDLDRTIQRWDSPPVVDPRTGRRGHPGEDFQCRCTAKPVMPTDGGEFDYGLR